MLDDSQQEQLDRTTMHVFDWGDWPFEHDFTVPQPESVRIFYSEDGQPYTRLEDYPELKPAPYLVRVTPCGRFEDLYSFVEVFTNGNRDFVKARWVGFKWTHADR